MGPRNPVLCRENRERQVALEGLKSSPKPLSDGPKCRERLRAVNRSNDLLGDPVNRMSANESVAVG
jgi:hypothetical protein